MYVIGIDPGPVTGIVALRLHMAGEQWSEHFVTGRLLGVEALQVTHGLVHEVLGVFAEYSPAVAVERFVVGPRAARSNAASDGAVTRDLIGLVQDWARRHELPCFARSAAEVKPWAADARLEAAGLLEPTKGMRHARDAARHALFCAVKSYGLPDPLSQKAGAR